jgi:hypothetical protein
MPMLRPLILPVVAAVAIAAPAPAATIQQDFDAAQALLDAGKAAEARNAFTILLNRFSPGSQRRAASLVRARLGNALLATGDPEAAEPLLIAAIAGLKGSTPQDAEERAAARFDLARAKEQQINFVDAASLYRILVADPAYTADLAREIGARAGLVRTLIWADPDEARRQADQLLAIPVEKFGKATELRALLETLRGRIELNAGNAAEAKRWFTMAAKSAGGAATAKVSVGDVRIRGDLALASFRLGNMVELQRFAALSGAGQLLSEGLATASEMPLPACAPLSGIAPDTVAVVEFSIADNGRTVSVAPIFVSQSSIESGDRPEILFAQAVRNWSWAPERLTKLDPFWRQAIRVELRCFTTRTGGDAVGNSWTKENSNWFKSMGFEPPLETPKSDAVALPVIRAEIQRLEARYGPQSPQLLNTLMFLANNSAAPAAERAAARVRFLDLAVANKAPNSVILLSRMAEFNWDSKPTKNSAERSRNMRDKYIALIAEQEAAGNGNTRILMTARLTLAAIHEELKATPASKALLDQIVAAPENLLPANDPIRIAALLRLSNQAAGARDTAAAANALAATGLSPEQCALVDVQPQAINDTITSRAFPALAIDWHTGGFARVGYDITAEGATTNVRTVTASPPFIFGPGTEKAVKRFRYRPVLRPGNTVGCSGSEFLQRFRVL